MTGPGSLRNRLAAVAVLTTAAWVVALTVLVNVLLNVQLARQADGVLRARAQAALATVDLDDRGRLSVREPPNDAALDAGIWVYEGTRAVDRPRARPDVQRAADRLARGRGSAFTVVEGTPAFRLYAQPVQLDGKRLGTVVSATDLDPYRSTSRAARYASMALAALLVGLAYLVTRGVVQRAMQPVAAMVAQARQWSAHDVARRFGAAPRPAELRDLAAALDALLDRIAAALRHEQQLVAELSHELRTPLSVITAETDLLRAGPRSEQERRRAYAVIAETALRMDRLLDTLLTQAAQDVTEAPGRCALEPVARAAAAAATDGVPTTVRVPAGLEAGAGAEVVERILAQLLGNAARYARTQIAVTATRTAQGVRIEVADDGPGVPETFRDKLFEPGQRAAPDDGHPGAGLGLALARRLARSAGGDIALEQAGPGAVFALTLPG